MDTPTLKIMLCVWSLALSFSIHEAITTRIPQQYEDGGSNGLDAINELRPTPNLSYWKTNRKLVYSWSFPENCSGITHVDVCESFASSTHKQIAEVVYFIIAYIIPSTVMTFCYGSILYKLFTRKTLIGAISSPISSTARRLEAAKKRHIIIIVIIVVAHVLQWGVYLIYRLIIHFITQDLTFSTHWLGYILKCFTYSNTIVNPLIYMVSTKIVKCCSDRPGQGHKLKVNKSASVSTIVTCVEK